MKESHSKHDDCMRSSKTVRFRMPDANWQIFRTQSIRPKSAILAKSTTQGRKELHQLPYKLLFVAPCLRNVRSMTWCWQDLLKSEITYLPEALDGDRHIRSS